LSVRRDLGDRRADSTKPDFAFLGGLSAEAGVFVAPSATTTSVL
jgi:hypothetical protein